MKNINEESEKFTHNEENHLKNNINNNQQQIVINNTPPPSIIKQPSQQQIINSQTTQQTQHRYHINTNNLNNLNNYRHHMYNMHNNMSLNNNNNNQRSLKNPKYLYYMAKNYIYYGNRMIQQFYSNLSNTLDFSISRSNINPLIKKFLRTKQIILIIYIINIQYLLSTVEKIKILNYLNNNSILLMFISIFIFYLHHYFFKNKLYLEKDEDIEKFVLKRNPQINKGKCQECDIIKIMRSNHCLYCNKCIKKYSFHSDWFNICIGANNELIYGITLLFILYYLFITNIIFWYYILFRRDLLNYLFLIFFIFSIIGLYINFNCASFFYSYTFKCLFVNLSVYEKNNSQRLTYLYGNTFRNQLFNPFNKGFQRNLEELFINMFDVDIYKEYKNYGCQNLSEIIEDNNKEEDDNKFDEMNQFKLILGLSEHFDPIISNKENIYKLVDGKEIINWNRLYLFTVFDVINSPFKDNMLKQAKFQMQQIENLKKNLINNNKINTEEKIDSNNEINTKEDNKEEDKEDNKEDIKEENNEENIKIKNDDNNTINNN